MRNYQIEAGQSSVNPIRDEDDLHNCIYFFSKKRDLAKTENKRKMYEYSFKI